MVRIQWTSVLMAVVVVILSVAQSSGKTLTLKRMFPPSSTQRNQLEAHIARDRARRHGRVNGDFHLSGNVSVAGIYYTEVAVGSPPQLFHLQVDTGSDLTWISCASCTNCPKVTSLDIQLQFYNIANSTTANLMYCEHRPAGCTDCSGTTSLCNYTVSYTDGTEISGYLVSDVLSIHPVNDGSSDSSAPIHFGCITSQVESLGLGNTYVDGILGFGPGNESVVNQISAQGITPRVFSHCLEGGDRGGGLLVMGEALHPNMVYTPLVPAQSHYTVNLEGIAVNGKTLPVPSAVFRNTTDKGRMIVDSGTTLAYFVAEIYDSFIDAISSHIPKQVKTYNYVKYLCYNVTASDIKLFPSITLHFAGGASMDLRPEDYLWNTTAIGSSHSMCMGLQKVEPDGFPVLGDIVLRDKTVVYDLYQQRLGWSPNLNCSSPMNVDPSYGFANDGERILKPSKLIANSILTVMFVLIL